MAEPGKRLYLGSTSIARAENAGRAFGPEGTLGSGPGTSTWGGASTLLASMRGRLFRDAEFAEFYCPDNGRDRPPSLLATALLLQSHDKVSDAEAKARADFDLRWKVALGIEAEDRPFAKSTLQGFGPADPGDKVREVFESSLRLARESGFLKGRGMPIGHDQHPGAWRGQGHLQYIGRRDRQIVAGAGGGGPSSGQGMCPGPGI